MTTINTINALTYYNAASGDSSLKENKWHINHSYKHIFEISSDFDSLNNEKITPEQSEAVSDVINTFSDQVGTPVLFRTKIIKDEVGGEDVQLELGERILTMLIDQSGSMSWNDNKGLRHDVAQRMVQKINSTYPGKVAFNLYEYKGEPIDVTLFALVDTDILDEKSFQSLANTFFQDEESNFAGVRVVRNAEAFPQHPLDGNIISEGYLNKVLDDDLDENKEYYYTVFTFDKNLHFSDGVRIKGTTRSRDIPRGIPRFEAEVLSGSAITRDDHVIGLWHMDEGSGKTIYDFSNSAQHLEIEVDNPIWVGKKDVPIGVSGLRLDGSSSVSGMSANEKTVLDPNGKLTIMTWIYPYDLDTERAIVGRQSETNKNYLFSQNANGGLSIRIGTSGIASSNNDILSILQWQHIAVTIDINNGTVEFYLDGDLDSTTTLTSTVTDISGAMYVDIGKDRTGGISRYFGKITEVSIHNIIRDANYIENSSVVPNSALKVDNGDRLIVLKYDIPNDRNFSKIRIIRNNKHIPNWGEDGKLLVEKNAVNGLNFVTDFDDLPLGTNVFYRIFSQNDFGNSSFIEDSPSLDVFIDSLSSLDLIGSLSPSLFAPSEFEARSGNNKVYLTWTNAVLDIRISRVEIYYSEKNFPIVDDSGLSDGKLIFRGDTFDTEFVHRRKTTSVDDTLKNGHVAYYTIVNRDIYGRLSSSINVSAIPEDGLNEIGIPLLDVEKIGIEIVHNNALSIYWRNPVQLKSNIDAFFDQRILIYASITDQFGQPISDDTDIELSLVSSMETTIQSEDVFSGTSLSLDVTNLPDSTFYEFFSTKPENGIIKGILSMTADTSLLSLLNTANFEIRVNAHVPVPDSALSINGKALNRLFEFESQSISIVLRNPLELKLFSRDARSVKETCKNFQDDLTAFVLGSTDEEEIATASGAYVTSTNPFFARVESSFRGQALLGEADVKLSIWDATSNICSDPFSPGKIRVSKTIKGPGNVVSLKRVTQPLLDQNGEETGETEIVSLVDIPLIVPKIKQGALIFAQMTYNGYTITKSMYLLFQDILKIDLTARAPLSDGLDVAEQFANVYLIDPDFPDDKSKNTPVPNGTIVRWKLDDVQFGQQRPFYSTDNVPNSNGIFSLVRNGVARNVFFGPASDVKLHEIVTRTGSLKTVGEEYRLSVSVIHNNMTANDSENIRLIPGPRESQHGNRILIEFEEFKNKIWSDGEDYLKLQISRNPFTAQTKYSGCFRNCIDATEDMALNLLPGQIVTIDTDSKLEILWGNVKEVVDPYTGLSELIVGQDAFSAHGTALIEISEEDSTFVFFRINAFVPPPSQSCKCTKATKKDNLFSQFNLADGLGLLNPCVCLKIEDDCPLEPRLCEEFIVIGSAKALVDNIPIVFKGGGSMQEGLPPALIVPKEPLQIRIVDQRVNDIPSDTFVVDGESVNSIIVEVSFAGKPVPDGTPVEIVLENTDSITTTRIELRDNIIYTKTKIDEDIDSDKEKSYATLYIEPIEASGVIAEKITFITRFDKSGIVERERSTCAVIEYSPSNLTVEQFKVSNIFSGRLDALNTETHHWKTDLALMGKPRGFLSLESVANKLYAIGGIDSKTISKFNEEYNIDNDSWSFKKSMPTARFAFMSVVVNDKIYIIGGLTTDESGEIIVVSRRCEVYDPLTDTWDILSEMPIVNDGTVDGSSYGVAYGVAEHMIVEGEHRIYILCGVTELDGEGSVKRYNDRILYYNVNNDTWTATDAFIGVQREIYKRISPVSFKVGDEYTDNRIIVVGGSVLLGFEDEFGIRGQELQLEFLTDSIAYSPLIDELVSNDHEFGRLPIPRYRAVSVSDNRNHYIFGGSNNKSQHLNISEIINSITSPFDVNNIDDLPRPRTGMSGSRGNLNDVTYIFVAGGFISGREQGFLQIRTVMTPDKMRLDGKQSVGVSVELIDENGDLPTKDISIVARGFIKFLTKESTQIADNIKKQQSEQNQQRRFDERTAVYPVLLSTRRLNITNGKGVFTLLPRAEDILESAVKEKIGEQLVENLLGSNIQTELITNTKIRISEGSSRNPYQILLELIVDDNEFYGRTIEDVTVFTKKQAKDITSLNIAELVQGPNPDMVFVVDVSGSTLNKMEGLPVGDQNDDGLFNSILDSQISVLSKFNRKLIEDPRNIRIGIVVFGSSAMFLNVAGSSSNNFTTPEAGESSSGTPNIETVLQSVQVGHGGVGQGTDYSAAFAKVLVLFNEMETLRENANLIFLTDGDSDTSGFENQISLLNERIGNIKAFGLGNNVSLSQLQKIDSAAFLISTTDQFLSLFGVQGTSKIILGCVDGVHLDVSIKWTSFSKGIQIDKVGSLNSLASSIDTDSSPTVFSVIPKSLSQLPSPIIETFSDISWIPTVNALLDTNDSTSLQVLNKIKNLRNSVPFGSSALYDAMISASVVLSDNNVDDKQKIIYVYTDNESNMSVASLSEAISEINSVDGNRQVPVVIGNFSVVEPITLSAKVNRTSIADLDKIAKQTGGQSFTVLSANFTDEIVDLFTSSATGALGFGLFEFTYDLGDIVNITQIMSFFHIIKNTSGTWRIEVSKDNNTYIAVDDVFDANDTVEFTELMARYVKFIITLQTGFSVSNDPVYEDVALGDQPEFLQVQIFYDTVKDIFLFSKDTIAPTVPQQVTVSLNADVDDIEDISVGVAVSNSYNWDDYHSVSQPSALHNGKIFIPIRHSLTDDHPVETLDQIDSYMFSAKYGPWNPLSTITIKNASGSTISSSEYKAYPRDGIIVFNSKKFESFTIQVNNSNVFRVGVRMKNRSNASPISVRGLAFMYNTNINLLPPVHNVAPQARKVIILPDAPEPFGTIKVTYEFFDLNGDLEDKSQRRIRWYINGIHKRILDNLLSWNDIKNNLDPLWVNVFTFTTDDFSNVDSNIEIARSKGEFIVKAGDKVHCTVEVNDGELLSDPIKSNTIQIVESQPKVNTAILIAQKDNGTQSSILTAEDSVILKFTLSSDSDSNNSLITWFVNGIQFKSMKFGETNKQGDEGKEIDIFADRLVPGEVDTLNNIGLLFNNEIFARIIPDTGLASGESIDTASIVVQNAIPRVSNVLIGPSKPRSSQNLILNYSFIDADVLLGDPGQQDESIIKWFKQDSVLEAFMEVPELQGQIIVNSTFTVSGQRWKATVTPSDGIDEGTIVESNTVIIA